MNKTLRYTILITADPYESQGFITATQVCRALLEKNHDIACVFLYHNAVNAGVNMACGKGYDENNHPIQAWQSLVAMQRFSCILCSQNALRRGIYDESYAKQYPSGQSKAIAPGFRLGGLSLFFEALAKSHRFIQFR